MGRQSDQDRVIGRKACFGLVDPRPTLIGIDGERLSRKVDKRHTPETAPQAGEELPMGLQFDMESIVKRHDDPQQKDGLPQILGW